MLYRAKGRLSKEVVQTFVKRRDIGRPRTRARTSFSMRAIRTFKDALYCRVKPLE